MFEKELEINVVDAAERRILETFNKNKFVSMSFSGGKDSICMADMVVKTMQKYGIPFNRLMVIFFDEEAIYPDVEKIVLQWRSKFMQLGAKFYWFCMPIKHFNCCNKLANDETFICWEPGKESVWVRDMPRFAIRNHKSFVMGMNYQTFGEKIFQSIPQMVGLRMAESVQRRAAIASMHKSKFVYPLYDWKDSDIWLYVKLHGLQIPVTYIYLYKVGVPLNKLRISQFFSIDTIKSLPKVLEFYPNLYERIVRREPNADLVMLYWDTDMFRSSRQDAAFGNDNKDYKKLLVEEMKKAALHPDDYPGHKWAKKLYARLTPRHSEKTYQKVYQILVAGDPKKRTYRVVVGDLIRDLQALDGNGK
jgi:predicted phosphoadenosine phosphosulfate sulfurtransferase